MKLFNCVARHELGAKRFLNEQKLIVPSADALNFNWGEDLKVNNPKHNSSIRFPVSKNASNIEIPKKPRYNEFGIQMISKSLYDQIFKGKSRDNDEKMIERCKNVLKSYNLDKTQEPTPDVDLKLPDLRGGSIEEHFLRIGEEQSGPYRKLLLDLLSTICPNRPKEWEMSPGWTRYSQDGIHRVDCPSEDAIVFDVEVCCSAGSLPTLATAVSKDAWYGWVSADLVESVHNNTVKRQFSPEHLIPLEISDNLEKARIAIGHNVSYDRARVKEQYFLEKTGMKFLDSLSVHVCISGVTSYQKALLKAGVGNEEWTKLTSLNSLGKVYELYCGGQLSKSDREIFLTGTLQDIKDDFQKLMNYCADDVFATFSIMKHMFPIFLERFPHPVTLAGMLELQSTYVPVNRNWKKYLTESQQAYEDLDLEAKGILVQSANEACQFLHDDKFKQDLWMWDQDWSVQHLSLKKTLSKKESSEPIEFFDESPDDNLDSAEQLRRNLKIKFKDVRSFCRRLPVRSTHLCGYPKWYRKMCDKPIDTLWTPEPEMVSTSMKVVPKLLRLTWKSMPLHCEKGFGWGYLLPYRADIPIEFGNNLPLKKLTECYLNEYEKCLCPCLENVKKNSKRKFVCMSKKQYQSNGFNFCKDDIGKFCGMVKLPHKDGSNLNVGNPLSRDFINKFSESELSGASDHSKKIIEISRMLSYWRNNRERIENQLVCWVSKANSSSNDYSLGVILPQLIVCGTLTRRAVEPTWMTASNAIVERVGSELRGVVQAPPGYALVGADVDSQELWIASLLGDSHCIGVHGATPLGWMTLNGQKSDGTDMHSVTAKAVGISRNHAKILNYARIYGAGQKFAERLLRQFNPHMSDSEASEKAAKMMSITKGKKMFKLKDDCLPGLKERFYTNKDARELCSIYQKNKEDLFSSVEWQGGSESSMFNCLEEIANQCKPSTPFLKSRLSRALEPNVDGNDKFMPTRINWVVQSGAVDFLHLMLVSMRWLLGEKPRFCLSFHDEVRYLVPSEHKYQTALALHVTNLLTRAFCVSRVGMHDLPQSIAFFSAVDVDTVLRKESNDDNKTPSNPFGLSKGYGVPVGESLDVYNCIKKSNGVVGLQ